MTDRFAHLPALKGGAVYLEAADVGRQRAIGDEEAKRVRLMEMHMIRHREVAMPEGEREYDLYGLMWRVRGTGEAAEVWLDASGENLRAQKIYDRAGYRLEGRLRDHWYRPTLGRNVDVMLYGLLRDDWTRMKAGL